jgi:hypothetical protein
MLKLIELGSMCRLLPCEDAPQMDMTEFFDFQNVPWALPPTPPAQVIDGTYNSSVLQ